MPLTFRSFTYSLVIVNIIGYYFFSQVQKTLKAGKLNQKVLKLFIATGKDEVLALIQALNIREIVAPVFPTSTFWTYS